MSGQVRHTGDGRDTRHSDIPAKILRIAAALIWMYVIYRFSDKPAVKSSMQSEGLSLYLVRIAARFIEIPVESQPELALSIEGYVREAAHFIEYAILFVLVYAALKAFTDSKRIAVYAGLVICFLYGCSDEIHQLFVPGRTCQLVDIVIDTAGAAAAAVVHLIFIRRSFFKDELEKS